MNQEVFTAGVERGGLTTDHEIRLLVCWLINKIKTPVGLTRLNNALQQDGLVNYFELARAVGQLLSSGHLSEVQDGEQGEKPMTVTELGQKAAESFERAIPLSVREKSLAALRENLLRERLEQENRVEIQPLSNGFRLELGITDVGNDLLNLSLYVPTRELCEQMKRRFLSDPTVIYHAVVSALTGEEFDTSSLREPEQF